MTAAVKKLGLGVVGLGRAFSIMLPTFARDPRIELVAAADPRVEARQQFEQDFGVKTFSSIEPLLEHDRVEAVYIATPHQFHAAHACLAAAHRKHLLVEKPMALSLDEGRAMIDAARAADVALIVGHSHSFDKPILETRKIIERGSVGRVRMISALNYTDYLYRPRRPEELVTAQGGGVIFNQAAHQVDIVRLLGGGRVKGVRAATGAWDPARATEGAYSCLLEFEDGVFASLVYSGYAHFDSDEFCGWIGEMGQPKDPADYGAARIALTRSIDELALKANRSYGGENFQPIASPKLAQHFGVVIASCERGDLRPLPTGVMIYGDSERRLIPLTAPDIPRVEVIDELCAAIDGTQKPLHSGEWALASLEVCLAILRSAQGEKEIPLENQYPTSVLRI